jgi:proteasome lid subunit RPN8/RPN11
MTLVMLPDDLRTRILREAADAHPRECCGLLEGSRDADGFRITALHPARNLAASADRFDIDPRDHFAAHKCARANGHGLIGCYHSHPHGACEPSATDRAGAEEENFLWLIAGGGQLNAFVPAKSGFSRLDWA